MTWPASMLVTRVRGRKTRRRPGTSTTRPTARGAPFAGVIMTTSRTRPTRSPMGSNTAVPARRAMYTREVALLTAASLVPGPVDAREAGRAGIPRAAPRPAGEPRESAASVGVKVRRDCRRDLARRQQAEPARTGVLPAGRVRACRHEALPGRRPPRGRLRDRTRADRVSPRRL